MTYGLHVIIRFELEQELIAGRLSTDRPARGLERPLRRVPRGRRARTTGSASCRTSTGRSAASATSRPTSSGTSSRVQIWEKVAEALPDLDAQIEAGEFAELGGWLRENLYALGRKFTPQETLERVAGGPLDPEPYLRYLHDEVRRRRRRVGARLALPGP